MKKKDLEKCKMFLEDTPDKDQLIIITKYEGEVIFQFAGVNLKNKSHRYKLIDMLSQAIGMIQAEILVEFGEYKS